MKPPYDVDPHSLRYMAIETEVYFRSKENTAAPGIPIATAATASQAQALAGAVNVIHLLHTKNVPPSQAAWLLARIQPDPTQARCQVCFQLRPKTQLAQHPYWGWICDESKGCECQAVACPNCMAEGYTLLECAFPEVDFLVDYVTGTCPLCHVPFISNDQGKTWNELPHDPDDLH